MNKISGNIRPEMRTKVFEYKGEAFKKAGQLFSGKGVNWMKLGFGKFMKACFSSKYRQFVKEAKTAYTEGKGIGERDVMSISGQKGVIGDMGFVGSEENTLLEEFLGELKDEVKQGNDAMLKELTELVEAGELDKEELEQVKDFYKNEVEGLIGGGKEDAQVMLAGIMLNHRVERALDFHTLLFTDDYAKMGTEELLDKLLSKDVSGMKSDAVLTSRVVEVLEEMIELGELNNEELGRVKEFSKENWGLLSGLEQYGESLNLKIRQAEYFDGIMKDGFEVGDADDFLNKVLTRGMSKRSGDVALSLKVMGLLQGLVEEGKLDQEGLGRVKEFVEQNWGLMKNVDSRLESVGVQLMLEVNRNLE